MLHVAIDLGGTESHICIRRADGTIVEQRRLRNERIKGALKRLEHSRVVIESSAESFAIADIAKELGHEVRVVPATLVRVLGVGARGIKTDRRDAEVLSEVSCRIDVPSIHVPRMISRERKSMCGTREALVKARTALINCVRGWMRTQLLKVRAGATQTFAERARERLDKQEDGVPEFIERLLISIENLSEQIKKANEDLMALAKEDDICKLLMSAPGVGPNTAIMFAATIDDVKRFNSGHAVESYLGLTPGENSSGTKQRRTGITKAGSRRTRYLLVQSAWSMWRTRPDDPAVKWAHQVAERRGKKIAIIALARKLAGMLFAMWRDGAQYDPSHVPSRRERTPRLT